VTIGAAGSHHVLATTIYGRAFGLEVHAVLVPQPRTEQAVTNARAAIGAGLHAHPAFAYAAVPFVLAPLLFARGTYFVPLGGTSVVGSMGYVDAARELAAQVRAGAMPEPDALVVTLGSGGTAAGLAAGLALEGLRTRVIAVCIADPWWVLGWMARRMSRACVRRAGGAAVAPCLEIERRYVGKGYAHPTEAGARAIALGAAMGLTLDPTYTAKTFAAVLDRVDTSDAKTLLYWHTLSSAPLAPLLTGAPAEDALDPRVRRLFV
jgi:D-cysteine desulfhydrase